jgi:hypothetical protein
MEEPQDDDWFPLLELLTFVPAAFLCAWVMAGFSLWTLFEFAVYAIVSSGPLIGVVAGCGMIWVIVRAFNRFKDAS